MNEIIKLLKKENVIFEFFGKEQIGEELTNKQWDKFVKTYNDKFANGSYEVAKMCITEFMEHEDSVCMDKVYIGEKMKKDKNGIPYNLEVPIYYNVQDGSYILEMDTMIDDFNDKLKSLDSLCVKLKKEKNNEN